MNSFNHYAYGAIGTWMVETIAGIHSDPEHPGFKHILLHPRMGGGLTRAGAAYQSPYGIIKSAWVLKVNSFIWEVTVPPNTTATAFVPAKEKTQVLEGGSPAEDAPGVRYIETLSSAVVFELGSGSYRFEVGG
jgi:alpha-L-rhamnosidase